MFRLRPAEFVWIAITQSLQRREKSVSSPLMELKQGPSRYSVILLWTVELFRCFLPLLCTFRQPVRYASYTQSSQSSKYDREREFSVFVASSKQQQHHHHQQTTVKQQVAVVMSGRRQARARNKLDASFRPSGGGAAAGGAAGGAGGGGAVSSSSVQHDDVASMLKGLEVGH